MASHSSFVKLNNVPTMVRTWGRWIEETPKDNEDIVILIPGNPGLTGYYQYFLKHLHDNLGYSCWTVGHSGHEEPDNNILKMPSLEQNKNLYNLQGQVDHKVEFFKKYVPENARVHLIGHSIGAHVVLELLKIPEINKRVENAYLLFPTFERMAESPHGQFLINYVTYLHLILTYLSIIFFYFPSFLQQFFIYIYCLITKTEKRFINTTIHLIRPSILSKIFFMAFDEMEKVKEVDLNFLKMNKDKLRLYYAVEDGWAPASYCRRLQQELPELKAEICTRNFDHAYILRHSEPAADMITEWIKSKA